MTRFASLTADRPEFAPPPQRGTIRAVILALIAHALLIAALTWGVHWKRDTDDEEVEAELWSSTVQRAAPRAAAPAPAPTPAPRPAPPPPPPPPPPQAMQPPLPPAPRAPDIALEREKKLREQKEQRELAQQQEEQKRQQEAAQQAAQQKKALEAKKQRELEQQEADRKQQEQQQKLADQKKQEQQKLADQKKKDAEAKQAAAAQAAAQASKDRQAQLKRLQALAGEAGSDDQDSAPHLGKGKGAGRGGPSGGYDAKVRAAVRPNVTFPDVNLVSGNPAVEIEVHTAPDGTIVGTPRIVTPSGVPAWDKAALNALIKTERMPRDIDGTVPTPMILKMRPKDLQ